MTHAQLKTRTFERLDEPTDGSGYHSGIDITAGLNWAQRFFVVLTLCLEKSAAFTLTGGATWFKVRTVLTDWLMPLRLEVSNAKIRPARLSELDALAASWQATAGTPERYSLQGLDLLAIYKQPAGDTAASWTYARTPTTLSAPTDTPEIPAEYQPLLVDGAILYCRLKEGGQELEKVLPGLKRFLDGAARLGKYGRQRSLDLRYDRLPAEIERFDVSRMLAELEKKLKPARIVEARETNG